jgi:aminoglycoside phosphotransferase (APT) family kinase protein
LTAVPREIAASPVSALPRIAEGCDADVFQWDANTVLRLSRSSPPDALDHAVSAVGAALAAGAPVPMVYRLLDVDGHEGIVIERLDPEHLLRRLVRAPWRVAAVGRIMGVVHAELHRVNAPGDLPCVHDVARERIARSRLPRERREPLLRALDRLPRGTQIHHGDFNPANLLQRYETGEWVAVDWSGAARGDPAADVAVTLAMIGAGRLPFGSAPLLGVVAPVGRRLMRAAYLRGYLAQHALDMSVVGRWQELWTALRPEPA